MTKSAAAAHAVAESVVGAPRDHLVPDGEIARELGGLSSMSLHRYDRDPAMIALGWPPPIKIKQRKYRSRLAFENFKRGLVRRAIEERRQHAPAAKNSITGTM